MKQWFVSVLLSLGLLAGCNGEPVYKGLNIVTYNYTPWDVDWVQIKDREGRMAASGAIGSGGGEGSVTCCYTLKGTDFSVSWSGIDGEEAIKHLTDGKMDELAFNREGNVHFDPKGIPAGEGPLYLELHIYPDEHMEMALSRELVGQTRIPIADTADWLYKHHRESFGGYRDIYEVIRVVGKVTKTAWTKYRIEEKRDFQQYMLFYFTVASNFDSDPQIAALLSAPGRKPGDLGKALAELPKEKIAQLKKTGTPPGDKNG